MASASPAEKWNVDDCNSKIVGARYYPDAFLDSVARRSSAPVRVHLDP